MIEFTLFIGIVWILVELIDLAQSHKIGPAVVQNATARLFTSFRPSVAIHLTLFYAFYLPLGYLLFQLSPLYKFDIILSWIAGGVVVAVPTIEIIRIRTDETWLLRRWIAKDLKEAEDPKAHLESLIQTIQSNKERESSKRALVVLREIATRGDSTASLVWNILEKYDLH